MPAVDGALIDRRVEVMWALEYKRKSGGVYVRNTWCGGVIKDVSTASSVDKSGLLRPWLRAATPPSGHVALSLNCTDLVPNGEAERQTSQSVRCCTTVGPKKNPVAGQVAYGVMTAP